MTTIHMTTQKNTINDLIQDLSDLYENNPHYILPYETALLLYKKADLSDLQKLAQKVRFLKVPEKKVSYLIDRNINYTNVCNTYCRFCEFFRSADHKEAYVLSLEEISEKIKELEAIGGTRILLQGGHHPDLKIDFYKNMLSELKKRHPLIRLDCFSPSEIHNLALIENKSAYEILKSLKESGLEGLPGGGAEILDDEIRTKVSPLKINTQRWLEIMSYAQQLGLYTSASMVIGFGETIEHRLNHLDRMRKLQAESLAKYHNGFGAFIAWPLQMDASRLGKSEQMKNIKIMKEDYFRLMAIARLFLYNFDHLQSSWPTLGPQIAEEALAYGLDDFGSTMMEENVVSQASEKTYQKLTVEEIKKHIKSAGFEPWQRNTVYKPIETILQ